MPTNSRVTITSYNPVAPASLTEPVAEGFEKLLDIEVERRPIGGEPVAAGMSEIAMWVGLIADVPTLVMLLRDVAQHTDRAKYLRDSIRNVLRGAKMSPQNDRRYIPFALHLGTSPEHPSLRFYFHGDLTDAQLGERLDKAIELVESLPIEAFSAQPGPQEYGFYWDAEAGHWRGKLYYTEDPMTTEGVWFPPDLWHD